MSDEKMAEIRKRHAFADEHKSVIRPSGFSWTVPGWQAHNDRATLLAEVERLQAEKDLDASSLVLQRQEIERLARERDEARAEVKRLREALSWYADQRNHFPVERRNPGDPDPAVIFVEEPPIMSDGGKRARKALWGKP